jgi:DNA repair protein RadC
MALQDPQSAHRIDDAATAATFFAALAKEEVEVLAIAYLGEDQRLLGMRQTRSTQHDRLAIPVRDIAADALAFDARAMVIAHNHPSGDATPSKSDRDATRLLMRALDPIDVRLLDHLIVTRSGITSSHALGLL